MLYKKEDYALNAVIYGCGVMGGAHAAAYQKEGIQIVGVCDQQIEKAESLAKKTVCRSYNELEMMLLEEKPDVISICTPAGSHATAAILAAKHGCGILCEKPFTWDLAEAKTAAKIIQKLGVPFRLGFKMRYEDVYREAISVIKSGKIGKPHNLFISHYQPLSEPAWYMDVGVTTELLIHAIDISCLIMSEAPLEVRMVSENRLGYLGEDQAYIVLSFSEGRKAFIAGGYMPGYPQVRGKHDFVFQFLCEEGYVSGKRNGNIDVFSPEGVSHYTPTAENAFALEIRDFIKTASGIPSGGATLHDAMISQSVLAAALYSAQSNSTIPIQYSYSEEE